MAADSMLLIFRRVCYRHALSLFFVVVTGLFLFSWWGSTRYSERHLIRLGPMTVDCFSANSLLRISFVKGGIAGWGKDTRYRQPNPRGKFLLRPAKPSFIRRNADIYEVAVGYWHLVLGGVIATAVCVVGIECWRRT